MLVERKKIHIAKTKSEVIFNGIGYVFFIGSIILLAIIWDHIPTEVPAHYNAAGVVDRWGSKWELIILPSTSFFILIFLSIFEKFPEWNNYPKRIYHANAKACYLTRRKLVNQLKNISVIVFAIYLYTSNKQCIRCETRISGFILHFIFIKLEFIIFGLDIYHIIQFEICNILWFFDSLFSYWIQCLITPLLIF